MSLKSDITDLVREVRSAGWAATLSKGGHWRCSGPPGSLVFFSSTPTDYRGVKNARSQLLRAGCPLKQAHKG